MMYIPTARGRKICIYLKIRKHDILKLRFWKRFISESLLSEEIDVNTKKNLRASKWIFLMLSQEDKVGVHWKAKGV